MQPLHLHRSAAAGTRVGRVVDTGGRAPRATAPLAAAARGSSSGSTAGASSGSNGSSWCSSSSSSSSSRRASQPLALPSAPAAAPQPRPQQRRRCPPPPAAARRRATSPVSSGLASILRDELKIEKERYRTPDAVLEGPPAGYELEDRPNSNVLLLQRSFGGEEIFVEVDLDAQGDGTADGDASEPGGDEDDELDALPPVAFMVNIMKADAVLSFSCETSGDDVAITHVSLQDAGADGEGEADEGEEPYPPYTGPVFEELDDTLQQAFTDYLEERGITPDFGGYLMELVHDKLEVEYMNWLTRVRDFVAN